jgi:hypothetical protein
MRGAPLSPDAMRLSQRSDQQSRFPGVDFGRPAKFMISRNMHRRYLNPGQCAMIGLPASQAPALMPVAAVALLGNRREPLEPLAIGIELFERISGCLETSSAGSLSRCHKTFVYTKIHQ